MGIYGWYGSAFHRSKEHWGSSPAYINVKLLQKGVNSLTFIYISTSALVLSDIANRNIINVNLNTHMPPADPTSEFLLPVHLVEEVLCSQEEVVDLAALLVSLGGVVDAQLRL